MTDPPTDDALTDEALMGLAIDEARAAAAREPADVPIGAVVVAPDGAVLATAGNRREADEDPTATPRSSRCAVRPPPRAAGTSPAARSWSPSSRARCAPARS